MEFPQEPSLRNDHNYNSQSRLGQDIASYIAFGACVQQNRVRQAGGPSVSQADPQHDPPDLLQSHPVLLHTFFFESGKKPAILPQPGL